MGYQESYVRINSEKHSFEDLLKLTKDLGKEFFESRCIQLVDIITLKSSIKGNLEEMCHPEIKYKFDEGERFLYFVGERSGQRSNEKMFGEHVLNGTEIYFTECFPSKEIFAENSKLASHEKFIW